AGEYLRKGRSVYVEGRLKTRKWQDKEGIDRYTTEIVADQMQMLGGRNDAAEGGGYGDSSPAPRQQQAPRPAPAPRAAAPAAPAAGGANLSDMDDDIPF